MLFLGPNDLRDFCYLLFSLGDFKFPIQLHFRLLQLLLTSGITI